MRFAGKVWRLLVGIKDGLVLILMLLFFMAIYAALSARPFVGTGQTGALVLDVSGAIVEQPAEADPLQYLAGGTPLREYRLRDMIGALDAAAGDDRIKAVVLDLDIFAGGGQVALADVAAAIERVKRGGKPVLAYATGYDDDAYFLASHASEVWLNPMGAVLIAGPGGTGLYFAELMERLGIDAEIFRVGTYKAAVEPFERSDMSPQAREANQALADALWERWQDEVTRVRPKAEVRAYAMRPADMLAAAGGDTARAALAAGLVDKIGDRTAFGNRVAEITGVEDEEQPGSFKAIDYDAWVSSNPAGDDGAIGILTVAGEIVDGEAGPGTAGSATISDALYTGLEERDLKALVVRIDSPGGSVIASEDIRRAVLAAKAKGLPVVISMGSVAASGGYWIATAGDRIFAEPETITGSIGVFGILPSFVGALDKLGVGADGVATTPMSGQPDVLRGLSPEAARVLQMGVENYYRQFVSLVATARKLPVQRVDQIAQGRVWDGGTARQLGLVDQFGSLDAAVAEAARRAELDPDTAKRVHLGADQGWLARLFLPQAEAAAGPRDAFSKIAARPERQLARALGEAKAILSGPAVQARCLQCPAPARPLSAADRQGLWAWLAGRLG